MTSPSLASFDVLVRKIRETFHSGRQAIKSEMIKTYWQTGKYIHEHLLYHKDRADYGSSVIPKLAGRAGLSESSLREMFQFNRRYPKIPHARGELGWAHFRKLSTIEDPRLRRDFLARASEGKWNTRELEEKIKKEVRPGRAEAAELPETVDRELITRPKLGTLYTYRLLEPDAVQKEAEEVLVDLGFAIYHRAAAVTSSGRLKPGDIVESRKVTSNKRQETGKSPTASPVSCHLSLVTSSRSDDDLFTYKAFVERVVDGDTFLVIIDLGFQMQTRQYLRLRALDCPEMSTAEGRRAKDFVTRLLKEAPFLFLTSTRSDKYDRYLADVFIPSKTFMKEWAKGSAVLSKSEDLLYLNNELLHLKLAVRMR